MQDLDDLNYEGEEIKLDKVRHIKYTIKGLKIIAKKFGSVVKGFNDMKAINLDFDEESMDNLALLLYAGLIYEDPKLTLDSVENFLTIGNMGKVFRKIMIAFNESTPKPKDDGGSEGDSGEPLSTST